MQPQVKIPANRNRKPAKVRLVQLLRLSALFWIFVLLTAITQLGGIAFLLARYLTRRIRAGAPVYVMLFAVFYLGLCLTSAYVAPLFGRIALPCSLNSDQPFSVRSPLFCLLNRNYVTPDTRKAVLALSSSLQQQFPGTKVLALDAGFPFFDGLPMLPHLSHSDGNSMDIALLYQDKTGKPLNGVTRSPVGYFAYEEPRPGDPEPCRDYSGLSLRWDLSWLQGLFRDYRLDEARTKAALHWLATDGAAYGVSKVIVEPHLVTRLDEGGDAIAFQGCRSARHDDHIHFEVSAP